MQRYTNNENGQLQPLDFSEEFCLDSENFASADNIDIMCNEMSYQNINIEKDVRLLSMKNSFSFELDFQEAHENIAGLSMKFESPKSLKRIRELNTAVTMREVDQDGKRFSFNDKKVKETLGSFNNLKAGTSAEFTTKLERELKNDPICLEIVPIEKFLDESSLKNNYVFNSVKQTSEHVTNLVDFEFRKDRVKKLRKKRHEGCSCKNSNCLRLHCACFKKLGVCSPTCKCDNCLNKNEFNKTRNFAIEKTKFIFSNAFAPHDPIDVTDIFRKQQKINPRGCNCKSGCSRNYCDCRKVNGKCSYICKCNVCHNEKVELSREEIMKIYKPSSRKKHKLVINYNKNINTGRPNIIEFQTYQNSK